MFLVLKGNWPSDSFRRSVRNKNGKVKIYTFTKDDPVQIEKRHFETLKKAIGHSLVVVEVDARGRLRKDVEATKHVLEKGTMAPKEKPKPAEEINDSAEEIENEQSDVGSDENSESNEDQANTENFDPAQLDRNESKSAVEADKDK